MAKCTCEVISACSSTWNSKYCSTVCACNDVTSCYDDCSAYLSTSQARDDFDSTKEDEVNTARDNFKGKKVIKISDLKAIRKYLNDIAKSKKDSSITIDELDKSKGDTVEAADADDPRKTSLKIGLLSGVNAASATYDLGNMGEIESEDIIDGSQLKTIAESIVDIALSCRCVGYSAQTCNDQCVCDCNY